MSAQAKFYIAQWDALVFGDVGWENWMVQLNKTIIALKSKRISIRKFQVHLSQNINNETQVENIPAMLNT